MPQSMKHRKYFCILYNVFLLRDKRVKTVLSDFISGKN